jgi:hypothetical protein
MTEYCTNDELRIWNLGHEDFCIKDFSKCKYAIKIGTQEYCGYCPQRCAKSEIIRGQAGCLWCKHSTKKIYSEKCVECLSNAKRINYEKAADCPDWFIPKSI